MKFQLVTTKKIVLQNKNNKEDVFPPDEQVLPTAWENVGVSKVTSKSSGWQKVVEDWFWQTSEATSS